MVRDFRCVAAAVWVSIVVLSAGTISAARRQPPVDHAPPSSAEQWLQLVIITTSLVIINTFYPTSVFFLEKLSASPESDASPRDHSMLVDGSGPTGGTARPLPAPETFDWRRGRLGEGHLGRLTHTTKFGW